MEQRKDCDTCAHEAKLGIEKPCRDCWKGDAWEPKKPEPDNINHPAHYEGNTSLECIDVMEIAFGAEAVGNFCLCNAFKYLWRYRQKGGADDIGKAKWYLEYTKGLNVFKNRQAIDKMNEHISKEEANE